MNIQNQTISMADGREISLETGKLAKQADGSVVVRMGDTMLLATVVASTEPREGVDFLPLSVDYQEKFAGMGKIPGGFLKREGRLSDYEILICRLVDRAIRPLFPDNWRCETQVLISMISGSQEALPDSLAALAASTALSLSDIPFAGPISEVRVVLKDGQYIVNPSREQQTDSKLDMMIGGTAADITMVEGELSEASEEELLEAIRVGHEAIKVQCAAQTELASKAGKAKREVPVPEEDEDLQAQLESAYYERIKEVFAQRIANKNERKEALKAIRKEYEASLPEEHEVDMGLVSRYFGKMEKKAARTVTLETRVRIDGRQLDEVRPIWSEVNYLPTAHGSAIFTRGETQSLVSVTLGTKMDEQMIDGAMISGYNKFILHYNFPPFSTGETKPMRGPGRREVGHGNLAHRALKAMLPPDEENPYAIRVVSDVLESNGSSSMATVCGGSLALMDSGLPFKSGVSGIAMGMISDAETGNYAILSDILGDEDHLGDMDFKVAGTRNGITAVQMDIKIDGLKFELLQEALEQAKRGRLHILDEMEKTIKVSRDDYKPNAPRSINFRIDKDLIGAIIGPGGKIIQEIQKTSGATVVVDEDDKSGIVTIFATSKESMDMAEGKIKAIAALPEVGETYSGKVKNIQPFGAFIEFMPGKDGLLHISEIKWEKIPSMDGVLQVGEEVQVKLIDIDKKTGKFRLSRKALLPKPEKQD